MCGLMVEKIRLDEVLLVFFVCFLENFEARTTRHPCLEGFQTP